jgi:hypothetical protein
MPKGKPWTVEQERKLQEFVKARLSPERIAVELGQSVDSIKHKMRRLGLEVVGFEKFSRPTTSKPSCNVLLCRTLLARHQLHPGKVSKCYVCELKARTKTVPPIFIFMRP